MKKYYTFCLASLLFLTSCNTGHNYRPIVDNPGPNYEHDLAYCQSLAKQASYANGDTASEVGAGAIVGGLLGGAIGALTGNVGKGAAWGAGVGGGHGAVKGTMSTKEQKKYIIRRCLLKKGYDIY